MESGPRVSIGVEEAEEGGRLCVWNSRAVGDGTGETGVEH